MAINLEKSGKKSGKTRKMGNSQEKPEKWIFASTKIFYSVNSQIQLFWKSFTDDHFDWIIFKYVVSNLFLFDSDISYLGACWDDSKWFNSTIFGHLSTWLT